MIKAVGIAVALVGSAVAGHSAFAEVPSAVAPGRVPEPAGLYQGALHGYTPNTVAGGTVVDAAQLATMIEQKKPILLDVAEKDRKPPSMSKDTPWFPIHRTISGAVYLQGGGNGTGDKGYAEAFKARVGALTGGDMARPIVVFCHPDCWGSYNAAKRLIGLGYTQVAWYRDGVEGWEGAGHETRSVKPDPAWVSSMPADPTQ